MENKIELIEPEEVKQARVKRYQRHLDRCQQCRDNPFDQCPAGILLLKAAAGGDNIPPPPPRPDVDFLAALIGSLRQTQRRS